MNGSTCANDTRTWISSLETFSLVTTECLVKNKCTQKELLILKNNLYAVQQLDAFGKFPTPGILELTLVNDGSYQECQRISGVKYETNYCYLFLYPKATPNISSLIAYRTAVCMPNSCDSQDLANLYNGIDGKIFHAKFAYCAKVEYEKDSAFWGYSIFLGVMVLIAILASTLDFIQDSVYGISSSKEKNIIRKILNTFSFWTNAGIILSIKEQKEGHIKSLDCIRAFSMSWVVAGHATLYFYTSENLLPLKYLANNVWNHLIINAILSVDTFFLLSGIVLSYMFFKQKQRSSVMKSPLTWIMFYVHRYLRLTPPIMIFIGFFTVYFNYVQGPFAASSGNLQEMQVDACKTSWWQNLLYINNFGQDNVSQCYGITWYLSVDTQLYIIAPIFIIGFYISFNIGTILIILGCLASIITTYVMYSLHDMTADIFVTDKSGHFSMIIYQKPWIRCTPYLIGIFTGYLIATLSKRKVRLNWALAIVGWLIAFIIGCACMFSNYDYDKGSYWDWFTRATYYNFTRIGWSIAVSWVIIANHFGWGGPINNFMSHPIWQPFGRLSYCAYIVHWFVMFYYLNLGERPVYFVSFWQIYCYYAIPITFLSFFAAFFWSCLFEISTGKLEKMLFDGLLGNKKPSPKVEEKNDEGEKEIEVIENTKV
ncbi:unnamed protein product [Caenorhabditis angaria]|uniref:Nose resistant-to-fluoxetine protein N-terminal domain-containing protein n=1 Tax=Caenorhabditis angaria TaxID=860376 RepID=A0A9P1ICH7_9PELO|nr:unnamed protein product [Caenorhabditis angaria]